tara:strand:+ start:3057 stop:5525 length:2469 start_codon:yes stop_codon:yes gene_type:complete
MRAVHAGSKEEADFVPMGMAHFLEHMSFRIQDGKIWSLAAKGDVINAMTNMDSTRFYVVHLPEQTAETIQVDAARFKEVHVPADKIPVECHAVINELERGQEAGNKMFQTTSAVAILEHPYHSSTIGTKTEVQKSTAKDMSNFRQRYYVPNNTTLIFAGAFDAEDVLKHVETHFGDMAPGNDCHPVHSPEPPQMGKRSVHLNIEAACPMICMAFRQPNGATKESLALKCISRLLWHNGVGRAKTLISNNVLHDVSTYSPRQIDPYLWFFHGTQERTSPEIRAGTEQKMLEILQSFSTNKVLDTELETVKISLRDDWSRSVESVTDMMNELGRCVTMGNWKDFVDREATLDQITPADIQNVAAKLFLETKMTVTHVIPTKAKKGEADTTPMHSVEGERSPSVSELPKPLSNAYGWHLNNVSATTNILHVPKAAYVRVTLSAKFAPEHHDIASIVTASMGKGMSAKGQTTTSALMTMHASRSFSHDHEFIHMSMEMPSSSMVTLQKASEVMFQNEWLSPNFSSDTVELQKRHLISEIKSLEKDQKYQTKSHFIKGLFENTLYHLPIDERIKALASTSLKDVQTFHNKWVSSGKGTYVTMVTPNEDAAWALGQIFPAHDVEPDRTFQWTAKPRSAQATNLKMPGFGSFQIMMGQTINATPLSKLFVAMECATNILGGGMTQRLMHTVREQRGLGTYGLYAVIQTVSPKTPPIFCVQGTFSPDSVKEGMACTKQLVQEWHAHGVTPIELEKAKSRMIGSRTIASDTVDNLHSSVLRYILEKKPPKQAMDAFKMLVQSLTIDDVNRAIKTCVDPSAFNEVVVGPTSL